MNAVGWVSIVFLILAVGMCVGFIVDAIYRFRDGRLTRNEARRMILASCFGFFLAGLATIVAYGSGWTSYQEIEDPLRVIGWLLAIAVPLGAIGAGALTYVLHAREDLTGRAILDAGDGIVVSFYGTMTALVIFGASITAFHMAA